MSEPRFNFIPSIDAGSEEIKKQKDIINKDGFEGNAAVIIGNENETDNIQKRIEKEGITKDLASYITLNKEIIIPKDDVPLFEGKLRKPLVPGTLIYPTRISNERTTSIDNCVFCYVDKDGNIAEIVITPKNISEFREDRDLYEESEGNIKLKNSNISFIYNKIIEKLKELGFMEPDHFTGMDLRDLVDEKIYLRSEKDLDESKKSQDQEFNF